MGWLMQVDSFMQPSAAGPHSAAVICSVKSHCEDLWLPSHVIVERLIVLCGRKGREGFKMTNPRGTAASEHKAETRIRFSFSSGVEFWMESRHRRVVRLPDFGTGPA